MACSRSDPFDKGPIAHAFATQACSVTLLSNKVANCRQYFQISIGQNSGQGITEKITPSMIRQGMPMSKVEALELVTTRSRDYQKNGGSEEIMKSCSKGLIFGLDRP